MNESRVPLVILGLGNVLCGDDGAGVEAVSQIERDYTPAAGARVLDGGTLGLSLLAYLTNADRAILVDAVLGDGAPGSLLQLEGEAVARASLGRLSPHQVGVADLILGARLLGQLPRDLVLIGVVPERIELAYGLSPGVAAAIPKLVEAVIAQARAFGFDFAPARGEA